MGQAKSKYTSYQEGDWPFVSALWARIEHGGRHESVSETIRSGFARTRHCIQGIKSEDEVDYTLLDKHWEEAHGFLWDAHTRGEKVFVHCIVGRNRSALIVTAEYMRKKRGNVALQNEGFQEQIVTFCSTAQSARPSTDTTLSTSTAKGTNQPIR
eukprot:scaffold45678_cov199-Amphora_coffeaeformis.AAC.2